jgi:superfamily II DNA or RNA helicase
MAVNLRDYQTKAVENIEAVLSAEKNVLFTLPTGGGKTIIGARIIEHAVERGERVLVLTHRREIRKQTSLKLLIDHGLIQAGLLADLSYPVQIASVQTLHARAIRTDKIPLPAASLIVIDEVQHVVARTWKQILEQYPNARRLGLTATPARADGRGLGSFFDVLIEGPPVAELIEQKHLVPAVYYAPAEPDLRGVKIQAGDYQIRQLAERMNRDNLVGHIVSTWHRHSQRRKTLVFCVDVGHSIHVRDELLKSGVRAEHLDGSTPKAERDEILARLASGETEVVCNVMVLTEGLDIPSVACIVLARPTRSLCLFRQMAGRGLRPAPGKTDLILLDHAGAVYRHGLLTDPIQWSLDVGRRADNPTHAGRSRSIFSRLLGCRQCGALRHGGEACGHCGWKPQRRPEVIVFAEGELALVKGGKKAKAEPPSPKDKQRFYQQLMALRLMRNEERIGKGKAPLKPTWAAAKYKDRFGSWPPFAWNSSPKAAAVSPEVQSWVRSRDIAFGKRMAKAQAA